MNQPASNAVNTSKKTQAAPRKPVPPKRAHLATATGTPDSSGSNLRLAHICRMNAAFRLGARCNLVALTRCAPPRARPNLTLDLQLAGTNNYPCTRLS